MNLDCSNIQTIKDISNQVDTIHKSEDKNSDRKWVSCGQNDEYFELYNKYKSHFQLYDEKIIAHLMCFCCKKLKPIGKEKVTWKQFYECMIKQIRTDKNFKFKNELLVNILNDLIKNNEDY